MVELQRQWATRHGAVLEGRDIGSKVFPSTPHKFFLDAELAVRVERRWNELRIRGMEELTREEVEREVVERDERDRNRTDSPLVYDETYTRIDTGELTPNEVVAMIVGRVRERSLDA